MNYMQQDFTIIKGHLLSQNEQCGSLGHCLYHGPNGMKCAVGILISADDYIPDMEDRDLAELIKKFGLFPDITEAHYRMLQDLQIMHDWDHPFLWPTLLQELATKHGVNYE